MPSFTESVREIIIEEFLLCEKTTMVGTLWRFLELCSITNKSTLFHKNALSGTIFAYEVSNFSEKHLCAIQILNEHVIIKNIFTKIRKSLQHFQTKETSICFPLGPQTPLFTLSFALVDFSNYWTGPLPCQMTSIFISSFYVITLRPVKRLVSTCIPLYAFNFKRVSSIMVACKIEFRHQQFLTVPINCWASVP